MMRQAPRPRAGRYTREGGMAAAARPRFHPRPIAETCHPFSDFFKKGGHVSLKAANEKCPELTFLPEVPKGGHVSEMETQRVARH